MKAMNTIEVDLDIKRNKRECVCFYQNDTNIIDFITCSGGAICSLNNVDNIIVNYKRPDGEIISRTLAVPTDTNIVSYELGLTEMAVLGHGNVEIQFYGNGKRLTSYMVDVYIKETIGVNFEYEETIPSLPEQILSIVSASERRIIDFINQYTEKINDIDDKLLLVDERLNTIDNNISAISSWVSQVERRTEATEERVELLNEQLNTTTQKINAAEGQLTSAIQRVNVMENNLNTVTQKSNSYEGTITSMNERLKVVENQIANMN